MKNIALLFICTGNYHIYWKEFYETAEKNLFPNENKTYFVFTDCKTLEYKDNPNVKVVYQRRLGFFYDTLMRFHMFLEHESELKNYDYIYFFNSNFVVKDVVTFEELNPENGMIAVEHPGFIGKSNTRFAYERNSISTACIPMNQGEHYFMGGLYGGTPKEFLKMCKVCCNNINEDLKKAFIAQWHDESHTNKYFLENKPKYVSSITYAWPEGWENSSIPKMILKNKHEQGHEKMRGMDEPVKIVSLLGGLANQMFQYAFFLKLKKQHEHVRLNITNNKYGAREFELSEAFNFNFKDVYLYEEMMNKFSCPAIVERNDNYGYKPELLNDANSLFYHGYWQCEKYFMDIKEDIYKAFEFPKFTDQINLVFAEEIKCTESVSIHVRRGDYLKIPNHGFITDAYYKEAIKYIKQRIPNVTFFVFSDDIEFCKKSFKVTNDIYFIDHNKDKRAFRDIQLMSLCKHNIITNSSFSWWGAWLNQNPNKIVVSPSRWFSDPTYCNVDIIPDSWVKIKA